jgi:RNA polymerase sigma factor (sigma-70 family)
MSTSPDTADSDGALLDLVARPGPQRSAAWNVLVARHSPRMWAVARSFALDAATAEDLVQTAWLRLIEHADRIQDRSAIGPWLCTVVRNEARKVVTRRRTVPTADAFDQRPASADPVDSGLLSRERAAALRSAFARLGEECRQLLRLLLADPPLSYDEIAVTLGRPRGALGPTRARCLTQLRSHLPEGTR